MLNILGPRQSRVHKIEISVCEACEWVGNFSPSQAIDLVRVKLVVDENARRQPIQNPTIPSAFVL
jgi:hypothetical protein